MDDHEEAVKRATRHYRRTEAAHKEAADAVAAAVVAALHAGKRPTDVTDWSPFTATYVRQLAREAGVPPARRTRRSPAGHDAATPNSDG